MDGKPPPKVPEPLFPLLRKLGATDVQRARSWLLAWLLDRLGQRVQEPPVASYYVQRWANGKWEPVLGPFYRQWAATQIARELTNMNARREYRVVGAGGVVSSSEPEANVGEEPHGERPSYG